MERKQKLKLNLPKEVPYKVKETADSLEIVVDLSKFEIIIEDIK